MTILAEGSGVSRSTDKQCPGSSALTPSKQVIGPGKAKNVKVWSMPRTSGRAVTKPEHSSALISEAKIEERSTCVALNSPVERANTKTVAGENETALTRLEDREHELTTQTYEHPFAFFHPKTWQ